MATRSVITGATGYICGRLVPELLTPDTTYAIWYATKQWPDSPRSATTRRPAPCDLRFAAITSRQLSSEATLIESGRHALGVLSLLA